MHIRTSFCGIEGCPGRVCLQPRSIAAEIHFLDALRHYARIGWDPSRRGLMWSLVPLNSDFPPLRLGFQFLGSDQYNTSAARKETFQLCAKLLPNVDFSIFYLDV